MPCLCPQEFGANGNVTDREESAPICEPVGTGMDKGSASGRRSKTKTGAGLKKVRAVEFYGGAVVIGI